MVEDYKFTLGDKFFFFFFFLLKYHFLLTSIASVKS